MGYISEATKYLIFLTFNVIIATCGTILLAFGAILKVDESKGVKNFASLSIGGFAIGIGVIAFILACFGCCGLFKKKSCMLTSYAAVLLVLFIIQLVLGAIALGAVNNSKCELNEELSRAVRDLFLKNDETSIKTVNALQTRFQCCGVNGPQFWKQMGKPYPISCCAIQQSTCENPYEDGCAGVYSRSIERNVHVIGGVAIGFTVIEIAGAILAWYIRLSIKDLEFD